MLNLIERLVAELERPRPLSARVTSYIGGTYGVDSDAIGHFLTEDLPKLEDYEIDLILSPLFTPALSDQAVFAGLLGKDSVGREEWPRLIEALVNRPVVGHLVTADGVSHSLTLREVTVERYVHRLRLEARISETLFRLIEEKIPEPDRATLKAVARRAIWEDSARGGILQQYIEKAIDVDAVELLKIVENHKPKDLSDLLARIPSRLEALRKEIDGPKVFFSDRVQEMHGGDRDQRRPADVLRSAKQSEFEFLQTFARLLEREVSRG